VEVIQNKSDTSTVDTDAGEKDKSVPVVLEMSNKLEEQNKLSTFGTRPLSAKQIEVGETFYMAGIRPIGASHLNITQTKNVMGGKRPVAPNSIDAKQIEVVETFSMAGIRPIGASHLEITQTRNVMGGKRPVAPNSIEDSKGQMDFLD
jgi:hypothetical protein